MGNNGKPGYTDNNVGMRRRNRGNTTSTSSTNSESTDSWIKPDLAYHLAQRGQINNNTGNNRRKREFTYMDDRTGGGV